MLGRLEILLKNGSIKYLSQKTKIILVEKKAVLLLDNASALGCEEELKSSYGLILITGSFKTIFRSPEEIKLPSPLNNAVHDEHVTLIELYNHVVPNNNLDED